MWRIRYHVPTGWWAVCKPGQLDRWCATREYAVKLCGWLSEWHREGAGP